MSTKLEQRVEAHKLANQLITLLEEEAPEAERRFFWEKIAEHAAACCRDHSKEPEPEGMTYEEAYRFEDEAVPYGVHAGRAVGDVRPGYWLHLTESHFGRKLTRYLRSKRFADRQTEDDDE